ncbi:MAG: hypothetical protein GY754_44200 [bacterium]|nr:hypothetical protein [bacterium]
MAIILIMGVALLSGLGTNKLKAKDSANRLAGAITYIKTNVGNEQGEEIQSLLNSHKKAEQDRISASISLNSWKKNKAKRNGLRAILLCERLLIKEEADRTQAMTETKGGLTENNITEDKIKSRLKSWFTIKGADGSDIIAWIKKNHTSQLPEWSSLGLHLKDVVRGKKYPKNYPCYTALVISAFQTGVISKRWLYNYWLPSDKDKDLKIKNDLFIKNGEVDTGNIDGIPACSTIVFDFTGMIKPLNHVVMSLGDGTSLSHNGGTAKKPNSVVLKNIAASEVDYFNNQVALQKIKTNLGRWEESKSHILPTRLLRCFYPARELDPISGKSKVAYEMKAYKPFWLGYNANEL